jgi:Skp family chaperone for outer membrane proteins
VSLCVFRAPLPADDLKKASDELKKKTRRRRNRIRKAAGKMKAMAKKMEEGLQGSEGTDGRRRENVEASIR